MLSGWALRELNSWGPNNNFRDNEPPAVTRHVALQTSTVDLKHKKLTLHQQEDADLVQGIPNMRQLVKELHCMFQLLLLATHPYSLLVGSLSWSVRLS